MLIGSPEKFWRIIREGKVTTYECSFFSIAEKLSATFSMVPVS